MTLQQIQALIKAGKREQALRQLAALCKHEPNNGEAWWLAAQLLNHPRQKSYALEQVLRIAPHHREARRQLERLTGVPPAEKQKAPVVYIEDARDNNTWFLAGVFLLLVLILAGLAVIYILREQQKQPDNPAVSENSALNHALTDVTETPLESSIITLTVPVTGGLPTLPPTWTASPTGTALPPSLTWTPSLTRTPTLTAVPPTWTLTATASPTIAPTVDMAQAVLGTYWNGNGDGSMEDSRMDGQSYVRFYEFPVRIYAATPLDHEYSTALNFSVNQLSNIVPMIRTDSESEADIWLYIEPAATYYDNCPANTVGCAGISARRGISGHVEVEGVVYILQDNGGNPIALCLHELIHALGVHVHSPDRHDIMWPRTDIDGRGTVLSDRDRKTLELLYQLPAWQ